MSVCPYCKEPATLSASGETRCLLAVCPACLNPCVVDGETASTVPGVSDIRTQSTEGSIGGAILRAAPKAIQELPILPEISTQIMALLRDSESTVKDIAQTISQDPAIAVKILQLANSALYGGLSAISSLDAACARLGTRTVANAVQAVANGKLYITGHKQFRELMRQYWVHAVATAHCSNHITNLIAEPRGDALFVAGLIHDVGAAVLLDIIASTRRGVLGELHDAPELVSEVLASYSHLVGLHVVHHWKLPPLFAMTTYFHRSPDLVPCDDLRTAAHVVCLAEAVAEASGFGAGGRAVSLVSHPSTKYLGLSDVKLAIMRADLEDAIRPILEIASA